MRLRSISRVTPILGDPLFQAFARSLADQDLSPVTVRDYLHDLKRFRTGRRGLTLPRHFAASDPLNALSQIVAHRARTLDSTSGELNLRKTIRQKRSRFWHVTLVIPSYGVVA